MHNVLNKCLMFDRRFGSFLKMFFQKKIGSLNCEPLYGYRLFFEFFKIPLDCFYNTGIKVFISNPAKLGCKLGCINCIS